MSSHSLMGAEHDAARAPVASANSSAAQFGSSSYSPHLSSGVFGSPKPRSSCVVKRSEIGEFGGVWLQGHGLSVASETLDFSSRVRRAAPSLHMGSDEPVVARYGAAKTPL